MPADQYAIRAQQAVKMMKDVDRTIEAVVCWSCSTDLPTYMEWDRQVLETIGDYTDYISLHRYVGKRDNDTPDYLAVTNAIDRQIEEVDAACRFVQARRRSKKRLYLCLDEWNVWYKNLQMDGEAKHAPHLIEEVYNLEDALVVAGFLNSFIRHADVLKIANLAQIANVIAPVLTRGDDLLVQSIFCPFEMFARRQDGVALQIRVQGPEYEGKTNGCVTFVDASAILAVGEVHIFASNRSTDDATPVSVSLADGSIAGLVSAELLTGPSPQAANSFEQPNVVCARPLTDVRIANGRASCKLPPLSVAALTLRLG